jgi:pilus assembly protein TadC
MDPHTSLIVWQVAGNTASFLALALLVHWLSGAAARSYATGTEARGRLRLLGAHEGLGPLLLGPLPTVLLPAIERWAERDVLLVRHYLESFDAALVRAGWRSGVAAEQFLAGALIWSVLGGGVPFLVAVIGAGSWGIGIVLLIAGAIAGFLIPQAALNAIAETRVRTIDKRLPFAIEFFLLSMEASASFESAIRVYCDRMPDDPLAEELETVLREIEYGAGIKDALTNLARRVQSDDVTAFVVAAVTGLDTGQPIKAVLTTQADVTRQRRYEAAEQIAKTASTKATFPLFLSAVAIMLLLVGPIVIRMTSGSLF